jgi:hypothetical protein
MKGATVRPAKLLMLMTLPLLARRWAKNALVVAMAPKKFTSKSQRKSSML